MNAAAQFVRCRQNSVAGGDFRTRCQVLKVMQKFKLDRLGSRVFEFILQNRTRQSRTLVIQRNERIPAGDFYLQRNIVVLKSQLAKGVFVFKRGVLETRKAFKLPSRKPCAFKPDCKFSQSEAGLRTASSGHFLCAIWQRPLR